MGQKHSILKDRAFIYVAVSSGVFMLLSHGMGMFNKFSFHDDVRYFNEVGETFTLGRWMLEILGRIWAFFMGSRNYSIPVISGTVTVLCIAASVYILIKAMKIDQPVLIVLLTGICISFPAVVGIFGYYFIAPYDYFGMFMCVLGAHIYYRYRSIPSALICSFLMALGVGVYQANVPVCVCSILIFMLQDIYESEGKWGYFWKQACINIGICLLFITEYFLINSIFLNKTGAQLSEYRGLSSFGVTTPAGYISRLIGTYIQFFSPTKDVPWNMYPFNAKYIHTLLVIVITVLVIRLLISVGKKSRPKAIELGLIFLVYPLASYFILVMVESIMVHGLMTYGMVFTFFPAVWVMEKTLKEDGMYRNVGKAAVILMVLILLFHVRFSNICYLKANVIQSQQISYYNSLATRIRDTEGYTDETPVVYINEFSKNDADYIGADYLFDIIKMHPYNVSNWLNDYCWKETMAMWCGFSPVQGDPEPLSGNEEVSKMPCYPDDGSIKKIDGQIVVKFAE